MRVAVLRQDTKVDLKLEQDLSSATAEKGQKVGLNVAGDLAVEGRAGPPVRITINPPTRYNGMPPLNAELCPHSVQRYAPAMGLETVSISSRPKACGMFTQEGNN